MLPSQFGEARSFVMHGARRDLALRLFISLLGLVIALKLAG